MQWRKKPAGTAILAVAAELAQHLDAGEQVLWLVSGGSNIEHQLSVLALLASQSTNTTRLTLLPVDERYGPSGHANSNMAKLIAGKPIQSSATIIDILSGNLPFFGTEQTYTKTYRSLRKQADFCLVTLGIGKDGHTAGVLPESVGVYTTEPIVGYSGPDYQRLSLSLHELTTCDVIVVLCYGEDKVSALKQLRNKTTSLTVVPAMILYNCHTVIIYNQQYKE